MCHILMYVCILIYILYIYVYIFYIFHVEIFSVHDDKIINRVCPKFYRELYIV